MIITYNNRLRTGRSLAQPTGRWTNGFGFDAAKRLTSVTSPAGTFTYTLGAAAAASPLIKKLLLPNTSYITNTYDNVARLKGTYLKNSSHTVLNSHQYTYNRGNQRTQQVFNAGSTVNYSYDRIGQLKIADSATASEDRGYVYDAAWNLNYRTNNTTPTTFTVNSKNQLTSSSAGYDGNGNLTNLSGPNFTAAVYDDENRLTTIQYAPYWYSDFVYDGLGRLRTRTDYATYAHTYVGSTSYIYDGMRVIQERDGSNVPTVSYTRGSDLSGTMEGAGGIGGLLARSHGYSAGSWSTHNFYHADGNGNITYLVDSSQALAAKYRYDPYGNTISLSGSLVGANTYRFSSKEMHANSGTYYYGYRWYDPNLQRWLNRDPIQERGGFNLYTHTANNPVTRIDPKGLQMAGPIARPWFPSDIKWHNISQFIQALTPFGGKCKNTSDGPEWALVGGPTSAANTWKKLNPGESTGAFEDCDGMTCGGGYYKVKGLERGNCHDPGNDCEKAKKRRWTPTSHGPDAESPTGTSGPTDTPPDY